MGQQLHIQFDQEGPRDLGAAIQRNKREPSIYLIIEELQKEVSHLKHSRAGHIGAYHKLKKAKA